MLPVFSSNSASSGSLCAKLAAVGSGIGADAVKRKHTRSIDMYTPIRLIAVTVLALAAGAGTLFAADGKVAGPLSMQQAVDKALAQRPGEVIGTDRERKHGREAWEVEIRDADGQVWELYFAIDDGSLLYEDRD
jgi:uncharacterized membrane protein YkoI